MDNKYRHTDILSSNLFRHTDNFMIGNRIRDYRDSKNVKIAVFAKQIGISQGSLSDIENGKTKPSADTLAKIVRHTDIDAAWLLTGEGKKPEKPVNEVAEKIGAMLNAMDKEAQQDVLKYAEKTQLLGELLAERQNKKAA
jgi:transcriptional regulator with XRE-family HTH domain